MKIQRLDQETKKNLLEDLLKRSPNQYSVYEKDVAKILEDVKREGDEALFGYTARFDGAHLDAETVRVTEQEIQEAYDQVDEELLGLSAEHYIIFALIMKSRDRTVGLTADRTEQFLVRK